METPQKAKSKSVQAKKTTNFDENDNPAFRQLDEEYDDKVAVGIDLEKQEKAQDDISVDLTREF